MDRSFQILIVDDDVDLALNLKDILQEEGYSSAVAKDGKTALTLCHEKEFDLVVADIKLPDIPGLELTAKLAELFPGLECIIITGHTSLESAIKAVKRRDIIAYESKPLDMNHLLSLIREIAERRQVEEEIKKARNDYFTIVNLTGDIIVTVNAEGKWVFLNDDACEFWGKPREVLLGVEFVDYLHPDDIETTTTAIQGMVESKQITRGVINRQKTPKGWRTVEWNANPILDEAGNYAGMQATGRDISDRKQAEDALRESEEKLRNIFRSSPDAITLSDLEGNITECNQATLEMHGFSSRKELIGKNALDLIAPKDHQVALENMKKTFKEGFSKNVEYTFLTKDGTEFPAELSASVVRDSSGRAVSLVAITSDITLRKRMEETLRTEHDRLQAVTQNIGVGLAVISRDYRIVWGNEVFRQMLGEVEGRPCYSVYCQRTDPCPGCDLGNMLEAGSGKIVHEQETKDCNDNTIWLEVVTTPIKDKEGDVAGALEVIMPITERKRIQEEMKRAYTAIETSPNATFTSNLEGRVIYANISAARMWGFENPVDMIGTDVVDYWTEKSREKAKEIVEILIRKDSYSGEELIGKRKDGTEFPVEANSAILRDSSGKPVGMTGSFLNITERKKTEKKIREYAEELEIRNLQLKVETRRAKESDRLKSEFLANMSHEIRTPLTAISGASHLLNESSLSSEQKELCDMITQSGENLLLLINDILDLARIEAGEVSLEEKEFSLRETLKKLILGFELNAKGKGIELDLIYSDSLPARIISDEGKLIQILSNLITNALKFTEKGRVEVRLESLTDSKIQVFIKDTGIGIPKEKLPHIFNKFYQVNGTVKRKYQGTGLGLTIVKRLVNFLGGEIKAQSTLKKGSTFSFSFPCRSVEEKIEEIVPHKEQAKAPPEVKEKTRKDINILIAEDDDFNYYIIGRFLKDYTISRAKDGKDALEKIEKKRFDLILMDIQMPKMDGLAATRKIREKNKDLPIIALTAKAMKGDEERCLAAGCTDYISKPIVPNELRAKIKQYTAERRVRGEKSSPVKPLDMEALYKNSGKDKRLARETLHMFVEYLPQQLSRIRKAITDNNSQELERFSHSLKGAAKSVGAPLMAEIASNLEKMAVSGTIAQTESTFSRLEKEKERFQEEAEKMSIS